MHDALRRATPPWSSPGGIIIYTGTRRETEEVATFIRDVCGLKASFYHAGLESEIRQARQDAFMNGQPTVMVATNAFGMGIDRPDVRLVLHFAMPGTLEAYYQEAGRAGRDGEPAEACLLYAPQDRALQQFFITTSIPNEADLQEVYRAIPPTNPQSNQPFVRLTIDNLSFVTGLHPVKVKVALEQLEKASVVTRLGDEGTTLLLQRKQWQETAVQTLLHHLQTYRRHREAQLQHMVRYAESKQCRRQLILDHFGDTEAATAVHCCDNCTPVLSVNSPTPPRPEPDKTPRTPAPQTNVETAVLDCVRAFPGKLPRSSIAKILVGSHSDRIARYQESRFYGRFPHLARQTVTQTVDDLIKRGQLILVGNKVTLPQSVAVNLPPAALPTPTMKANDLIRQIVAWGDEGEPTAVPTLIAALQHNNGNVRRLAASALGKLRQPEAVQPLLDLLTREQKPQVRQYIVKALGSIGDPSAAPRLRQIAQDEQEMYYTRDSAQKALKRLRPRTHSSPAPPATPRQPEELNAKIRTFLSSAHVQTLTGPWAMGWALDFHSRFVGAEWQRSPVGELLFRLKYQEEVAVLPQLSQYMAALVTNIPELVQVDLVTPTPPSAKRPFDAVQLLAELAANRLHKPVQNVIIRVKSSAPQKEMRTLAQKQQNVAGAFACAPSVQGQTILVVDDLFDSGATLAEITRLLKQRGARRIYVLTITRTIHTD